jgi:hypothetical protein
MRGLKGVLVVALVASLGLISPTWAEPPATPNSLDLIISDMQGPHQGMMDGVSETCTWCYQPRINYGNNPSRGGYTAFTQWGVIFLEKGTDVPPNVRIQIRHLRAYVFSKQRLTWQPLQAAHTMCGYHYPNDFTEAPTPANTRTEPDGTRSITMVKGFNYHFWPCGPHVAIDPGDIGGIFTTYQARLIPDTPTGPNHLAEARFLAHSGADYWLNPPTGQGNPIENDDVALGKFKFLTPQWQSFNMHTMTEAELRTNPPPLD